VPVQLGQRLDLGRREQVREPRLVERPRELRFGAPLGLGAVVRLEELTHAHAPL